MSLDLYETLGVARDADAAAIKAGYRRRARETHPDITGSSEEFLAVARAFHVLSDPEKRHIYDETGMLPDDVDAVRRAMLEAMGGFFDDVIEQIAGAGKALDQVDIIGVMRDSLRLQADRNGKALRDSRRKLHDLEALARRIRRGDGGVNVFSERLKRRIEGLAAEVDGLGAALELARMIGDELDAYDSAVDMLWSLQRSAWPAAGTNAATGNGWFRAPVVRFDWSGA